MTAESIRLSYNAQLYRVRCEITRAQSLGGEEPPYDLVTRARSKLESVKKCGEIDFLMVYETRLKDIWKALQQAVHLPDTARCVFTLGAGAPFLSGLTVEKPVSDRAIGSLSAGPWTAAQGHYAVEWFRLNVVRQLREFGIREQPYDAQLNALFCRLQNGETLRSQPLNSVSVLGGSGQSGARPLAVVANKQRLEVVLIVRSLQELATKEQRDHVFQIVQQAVTQLAQPGVQFTQFKKEASLDIQAAQEGPEFLGVDLPMTILAAIGLSTESKTVGQKKTAELLPELNYPGAALISFAVTPDRMEAAISGFKPEYYEDPSFKVDVEWISKELKRSGIKTPIPDDVVKILSEAIANRAHLDGLVATRGKSGTPGKGPFLYHSFRDAKEKAPSADLDNDSLNIREMQNRNTVTQGQLVAEIRFKVSPESGLDIYGEVVPPPAGDVLPVIAGNGVELRDQTKFFALEDGTPMIEGDTITISKTLVHKGDVNLRSGNIRFPGPVEITGSIDQGAIVEAEGDITIHGEIRGGKVLARGNISVKGGVTTGTTGWIRCNGDFHAEFVDGSHLLVSGNIVIKKVLLNSHVVCGGTIQVLASEGTLGGGKVICRDSLSTGHLGFRNGAVTTLHVGVDWRAAQAIEVRTARIEKLSQKMQEDRLALRELVQKNKAQMTPRHAQMKDALQVKLTRLRAIIERLEALVAVFKGRLTFSSTAQIYVRGTLASSVRMELCGQTIAILSEVASVCVSSKRRRGSHIIPLEEIQKEEEDNGTSPFQTDKKAG